MNARYYVPNTNRFLTPDSIIPQPTDPQSYNRYSYARNNPLKYVDPTGHYYADLPNLNGLQGDPLPPEKTDGCITRPERCSESSQEVFGEPIEDAFLTGRSAGFDNDPDNEIPDHLGIDAGPVDNVLASANGIVRIVDENGYAGTGKVVIVEYVYDVIPDNLREAWGLEPGQSVFFEYQHLGSISVVEGQMVKQGDILGTVGGTGNANGNEHLHLEARIGSYGALVDHTSYDSTTDRTWQSLALIDPNKAWNLPLAPWITGN